MAALRSSSSSTVPFSAQTLKRHFDHADRAVNDHLARVDDGAGLLALEHDGRDLGRIGEVGDARFDDLKARVGDLGLNFIADARGHDLARAAQAPLVGLTVARGVDIRGDVVGIDAHDVAQCCCRTGATGTPCSYPR